MWRDSRLQLLLAIGSLAVMAGGVLSPNLPEIIHQLHFDPGIAGSLVSLHFLTVALSVALFGMLVDTRGALPVLVPSLVLYALFGVAGAAMHSLMPMMATRALLGIATGGITAASLGLMGKIYHGETRSLVLAYTSSAISLAGIVYPLLGAWLGSFHWQWAFYLYGAGLPLAALSIWVFGYQQPVVLESSAPAGPLAQPTAHHPNPDAHSQPSAVPNLGQLLQLLRDPQTLRLLLALGTTSATVYATIVYIPLYLRTTLSAETVVIGVVLAAKAMGATCVSAFGVRPLTKAWGSLGAIALGYGIMAFTLIALPHLQHIGLVLLTAIVFGIGFGIVIPSLYGLLAEQASIHLQGSILAAGTGSGFLGQFLSPLVLAPVFSMGGISTVFYTAATIALLVGAVVVFRFGDRKTHRPVSSKP